MKKIDRIDNKDTRTHSFVLNEVIDAVNVLTKDASIDSRSLDGLDERLSGIEVLAACITEKCTCDNPDPKRWPHCSDNKLDTCPDCGGSGRLKGYDWPCSTCNGTGKKPDIRADLMVPIKKKCCWICESLNHGGQEYRIRCDAGNRDYIPFYEVHSFWCKDFQLNKKLF